MKMRKLLAASVAASVAVTSMAAIASAEEKTFNFLTNYGVGKFEVGDGAAYDLGDKFSMTDDEFTGKVKSYGLTSITDDINLADGWIAFSTTNIEAKYIKVEITGVKGTRTAGSKTYTYELKSAEDDCFKDDQFADMNASYVYLPVYAGAAPEGGFLPEQFLEITKIKFVVDGLEITLVTYDEDEYNTWGDTVNDLGWEVAGGMSPITWADNYFGEWHTEGEALAQIIADNGGAGWWTSFVSKEVKEEYAFLPRTTLEEGDTINRNEVNVLSDTGAYNSASAGAEFWSVVGDGTVVDNVIVGEGQTYDDNNLGTIPNRFAGLASQMADFFNKQTNGTVTFKFTPPVSSTSGGSWAAGGVPSTEVGIKNMLSSAQTNDFALFVNYNATTGSLQATTEIDAASGTVTFDISEILDDMGGLTKASLQDVYYGLNKGIDTWEDTAGNKVPGMYVESVTLAYDEDGDVDADIEEEDDDADVEIEDDVEVEEDDDVEIEEDDDVEIDEDDADGDDADAEGDVIVGSEDDDANPGTGVALAVVPALVAAAAVVVSKKRS